MATTDHSTTESLVVAADADLAEAAAEPLRDRDDVAVSTETDTESLPARLGLGADDRFAGLGARVRRRRRPRRDGARRVGPSV